MKCKECGKEFVPLSVNQMYCSNACGQRYRRKHDVSEFYPSITFKCSQCGKTVVTEGGVKDKRQRFCCHTCEKNYWKHRSKIEKNGQSERTNFHSFSEYAAYERYSNENF